MLMLDCAYNITNWSRVNKIGPRVAAGKGVEEFVERKPRKLKVWSRVDCPSLIQSHPESFL
jgi:hypothetical protein